MCVPLFELEAYIRAFERCGVDYLHMDVMDGCFVPNIMLGTDFIRQIRKLSYIPLDIHLMVERPEDKLDWFDIRPGEYVSFHVEATNHAQRICAKIRDKGARPMAAINPATPICVLEDLLPDLDGVLVMAVNPGYAGQKLIPQTLGKISRLKRMLADAGRDDVEIEADGNTSLENAALMRASGADIFVAGTAGLFIGGDLETNINNFKKSIA
jgi:ribulose-phosphate 3-epimerase